MDDHPEATASSGNIFRDLGFADPEAEQRKADARLVRLPPEDGLRATVARALSAEANGLDVAKKNWPAWLHSADAAISAIATHPATLDDEAWRVAQLAVVLVPAIAEHGDAHDGPPRTLGEAAIANAWDLLEGARRKVRAERGVRPTEATR